MWSEFAHEHNVVKLLCMKLVDRFTCVKIVWYKYPGDFQTFSAHGDYYHVSVLLLLKKWLLVSRNELLHTNSF